MALTLRQLLALPKQALPPGRRKRKSHPSHRAWDLEVTTEAEIAGMLVAYIRINVDLPESFSIGLRYHPDAGAPAVLLRLNGDHGAHRNPDGSWFDEGSHIHRPTVISDNYICRLATTTSAGGSAVRTACATVRS